VIASLPLALAIAASPFAIMPAIMLLLTPRPRLTAGSFLAAWFLGVGTAAAAAVGFADVAEEYSPSPAWVAWVRIVLALVIGALAVRTWLGRGKGKGQPAWMAAMSSAGPRKAFGLGFVLSLANPKVLALAIAGGAAIGAQPIAYTREVLHVLAFTAVASATVALPLVAHLIAGERALPVLERMQLWLDRHSAAITAVVLGAIAVALGVGGTLSLVNA
jgi:threonine/homoserine/homoserine lactone efflux protein